MNHITFGLAVNPNRTIKVSAPLNVEYYKDDYYEREEWTAVKRIRSGDEDLVLSYRSSWQANRFERFRDDGFIVRCERYRRVDGKFLGVIRGLAFHEAVKWQP